MSGYLPPNPSPFQFPTPLSLHCKAPQLGEQTNKRDYAGLFEGGWFSVIKPYFDCIAQLTHPKNLKRGWVQPDQTKINGTDSMTQVSEAESRVLAFMYQHIFTIFAVLNFWHFSVRKLESLHLKEILCKAIFDLYLCIVHTPISHALNLNFQI